MSNSPLVSYTKLSPFHSWRENPVDKITIHHMAGIMSVERCGAWFNNPNARCSSNYGIDSDGNVGMYVEEGNRSWASANAANDNRAVTIEVSNDSGAPDWHVSDKALAKLIDLCEDICRRNSISALNYTGDASGNVTTHKMFIATACPGPYLESKIPYIVEEVNKRLNPVPDKPIYRVQVGAFTVKENADRMLEKLKEAGFEGYVRT